MVLMGNYEGYGFLRLLLTALERAKKQKIHLRL